MSRDTGDRWSDHPCEALSALVDGELQAGERAAVEAHLAACPVCRALKDDVELLQRAVAAEPPPPVPTDLAARIRGRLAERAPASAIPVTRPWWAPRWPVPMPAAAAAAAVVVAALAWLAWPGGRPPGVAVRTGDIADHEAAGAAGAAAADALSNLRSLGYIGPAEPPKTAPAPASVPAPGLTLAPPPPAKPMRARSQAPTEIARGNVEAKARAPESSADAETGTRSENRPVELQTPAYDGAWSRADGNAGRAELDARVSPQKTLKKDAARAAEPVTTPMALREAAVSEATSAAIASPSTPRPLDASPYVVSLEPEDAMTVRVRDYECTIPIAPADARLLAGFSAAATTQAAASVPAARKAEVGVAPAAGAPATPAVGPTAPPRPAAPSAGTPSPGSAAGSQGAVAQPAEPTPVVLPPAAHQMVVYLVRERYRALIEARCGPLPR